MKSIFEQIQRLERAFSRNKYNGGGRKNFRFVRGRIPVVVSAPHAVNHFRNGEIKRADLFTGGIARWLAEKTGCHCITSTRFSKSDPNFDPNENGANRYQESLCQYVSENDIQIVIDLHGAAATRPYFVEIGTAPVLNPLDGSVDENRSLHGHFFIASLIRYSMEFVFGNVPGTDICVQNRVFTAAEQNTVTKQVSMATEAAAVQLEINQKCRKDKDLLEQLVKGLCIVIETLGAVDWNAESISVFRLWQASEHKPQDRIWLPSTAFRERTGDGNSLYVVSQRNSIQQAVRIAAKGADSLAEVEKAFHFGDVANYVREEYVFLTNRLISQLFGRNWIEPGEETSGIARFPILLTEPRRKRFLIGMPAADKVERITLSSALFGSIERNPRRFAYCVYNRYTDTHFFLDINRADYGDFGQVKAKDGTPGKKVMIPRYHKKLLGYLERPFDMIREEEFVAAREKLIRVIREMIRNAPGGGACPGLKRLAFLLPGIALETRAPQQGEQLESEAIEKVRTLLDSCYGKIPGEVFFTLKTDNPQVLHDAASLFDLLDAYQTVDLIKIPVPSDCASARPGRIRRGLAWLFRRFLETCVGKEDYLLKTVWTSETDDKNNVGRINSNMMNLLGVSENDKLEVAFGPRTIFLRVLKNDDLTDYQIGIPAAARKKLAMNSVNDVVVACRDMQHVFKRNSQQQTIAILGTILAVFQVVSSLATGFILCLILIPIMLYIVLFEERIKIR